MKKLNKIPVYVFIILWIGVIVGIGYIGASTDNRKYPFNESWVMCCVALLILQVVFAAIVYLIRSIKNQK